MIERIRARIHELRPTRVVIDSLSELRHLAGEGPRYRLHMEALKPSLLEHDSTVILADGPIAGVGGFALHTLVHGVIRLEYLTPEFGPYRRRLRVQKLRNVRFLEGLHDFEIRTGGITVYPRLVQVEQRQTRPAGRSRPASTELDTILAGGLDRGTSTLLMGPAGSGKSSLATQVALAGLQRGEKAAMYLFDERVPILLARSQGLGMELHPYLENGQLVARHIDPLELSPGKFAHMVRTAVEDGMRTVIIDSLTGYMASMGDEASLMLQIRNLLTYLGEHGVTTLLVSVQHGLMGPVDAPAGHVSYLADTVVLLRYYEHGGEVRRAVSVFKRRAGAHERTIRDIDFAATGISVGATAAAVPGRAHRRAGTPAGDRDGMTAVSAGVALERRVVMLPPSSADGAVALQVLMAAGIETALCSTAADVLRHGPGGRGSPRARRGSAGRGWTSRACWTFSTTSRPGRTSR